LWSRGGIDSCPSVTEKTVMKTFMSMFALTLVLAFTVPAFAGSAETKEQCQKDGGAWDAKTKHCSGKY
jgi:hypothetical protein